VVFPPAPSGRWMARLPGVTEPDRAPMTDHRGPRYLLVGLLAVEVLSLVSFAGFYVDQLAQGHTETPSRVVMSVVFLLASAAALAAMARGWVGGRGWVRTPTIVWSALLLPVAWGLSQGGLAGIALAVGVAGVAGIVSALAVPPTGWGPEDREVRGGTEPGD